jgi:predicted nucleotide-binding protein
MNEREAQKIPSDLAGWIYLLYDPSNALALRPALERAVAHLLKS